MQQICADLAAETADLRLHLTGLSEEQWLLPTPAAGWDIRDQITHLAYFDDRAVEALRDPEAFAARLADVARVGDPSELANALAAEHRHLRGGEALEWWDRARTDLLATYSPLDPRERVVWYGPTMSVKSKVTARLMETWAHGQDVVDALGRHRRVTGRIRHVCHLGVRARGFAYMANRLTPPDADIHVVLTGPGGEVWEWGDPDSGQRIEGPAIDFALVATQRRHRDDTELAATGPDAHRWLTIAQAFAGPPGSGRPPRSA